MRRKLLSSSLATLCGVLVVFAASITATPAHASQGPDCNYRVTVADGVNCIVYLTTSWSNGSFDFQGLSFIANYQFRLPGTPGNCGDPPPNPAITLDWFSLDGGATQIYPNMAPRMIIVDGCCLKVYSMIDTSGYTLIVIEPC